MFAAPPEIETRIFARIPDRYRVTGRPSVWIDAQRGRLPTDCFLEGPSFDRAGNLYVVDVPWGRVFCISPAGEVDLATEYDGEPNGLKNVSTPRHKFKSRARKQRESLILPVRL